MLTRAIPKGNRRSNAQTPKISTSAQRREALSHAQTLKDHRASEHGTKRPASRDLPGGAVRLTHHRQGIERPLRRTPIINAWPPKGSPLLTSQAPIREPEQIFSSQCHAEHAEANFHKLEPSWMITSTKPLVEPDGIEPTTSCLQSTRSPS